jgi:Holliday junction resolvasome RuvABC ATP-dependent DNA helicase subunit
MTTINPVAAQQQTADRLRRLLTIYVESNTVIRPHCFLTGPSGAGKTAVIMMLCQEMGIEMREINAAALTKEGLSGNSLSKALAVVKDIPADGFGVVFVDEHSSLLH